MSKPIECTTPRGNPKLNDGLWTIMMCHCRFTSCNKCPALVRDFDKEEGCACVVAGNMWDGSAPFVQFCYEPKATLKKESLFKKKKKKEKKRKMSL